MRPPLTLARIAFVFAFGVLLGPRNAGAASITVDASITQATPTGAFSADLVVGDDLTVNVRWDIPSLITSYSLTFINPDLTVLSPALYDVGPLLPSFGSIITAIVLVPGGFSTGAALFDPSSASCTDAACEGILFSLQFFAVGPGVVTVADSGNFVPLFSGEVRVTETRPPVPEPSTLSLLMSGMTIAFLRRRGAIRRRA